MPIRTQVYLTGNPIIIDIPAAANSATPRSKYIYRCKVYVQEAPGSPNFKLVGTKQKHEVPPYVKNGVTYYDGAKIDIADILDANITIDTPEKEAYPTTAFIPVKLTTNSIIFYTETDCVTLATTPVVSPQKIALKGLMSKRQFALWKDAYFTDTTRNFALSSRFQNEDINIGGGVYVPFYVTKNVFADTPEYLSVINNVYPNSGTLGFYIEIHFTNGYSYGPTTGVVILNPIYGSVYRLAVGPAQINFAAMSPALPYPASMIDWYVIQILGGYTSKKYKYNIIPKKTKYAARHVIFQNSLSGYETLSFIGKSIETAKVSRSVVDKVTAGYDLPTIKELETVAVEGVHELSLNTGIMEYYDRNFLLELLYSKDIRILTQEGYLPLQLATDTMVYADETEFVKQNTFNFRFSNTEQAGSYLPAAVVAPARPTSWQGVAPFCMVNDNGLYTGKMKYASLQLYYADGAKEVVPGAQPKPNIEGTAGYIAEAPSPTCVVNTAPFTNVLYTVKGTYRKTTCVSPQIGDYPTITIAAGTYGDTTQAKADARARDAAILLDTQDYANTGAGAAACITGPWAYAMAGIPAGKFNLRWGQRVQNNLTGIQGGPGASSGAPADLIYGNYWVVYQSTNAGSIYYAPSLFDNLLPIAPGGSGNYQLIVHTTTPKVVTVYKNGITVFTNTITAGDLGTNNYKSITITGMTYATGDRYYINIV